MRDPFSILCHSNALSFTDLLSLWSDDDSDYVEIVMLYAVCTRWTYMRDPISI